MAARTETRPNLTLSTLWLLTAKIVGFTINIALPLLVVRRLSQVEFGYYKQAFLTVTTANAILPFGFVMTGFYYFPRKSEQRREVILNILAVYGGMGLLASFGLLVQPHLLDWLFRDAAMVRYAPILAVLLPLWIISGLLETVPLIHQEFKMATLFTIGSQLTRTGFLLAGAFLFGSVQALLYGAILHALAQTAILLWYLESRLPGFWKRFDGALLCSQLSYALPFGYTGLLWALQNDLHNYFVSHYYGAAVFAIYSVGCFQIPLVGMLSEAAASVMMGRVSELQMRKDTAAIIEVCARVFRNLAALAFPVYAFLLVMGRELLTLLFTRRYADSWSIFAVNISIVLLMPIVLDPIVRAYPQHMPFLVKARTALFLLMSGALWQGTTRFGPVGAITVAVAASFADRGLTAAYCARILGMRWSDLARFADLAKIALAAALAGLTTASLPSSVTELAPVVLLMFCGSAHFLVFGVFLFIFDIPTTQERREMMKAVVVRMKHLSRSRT